jgi:GT2 family glycosyltransferase
MSVIKLVSIIIVVKNDRGIAATLEHLHKLACPIPFEVIVVDSSLPERLADIKVANPWVRWERFPYSTKRTTPAQRNRGVELAGGELIAFIDANCIPGPEWLEAMVEATTQGTDIVCGPVLDANKTNLVHYAPEHSEGKYVDTATTISVGIRSIVFERIGNFDTSFAFGQDIDFFWRATDAGFRIYYHPNVQISHDWGDKKEQLSRAYQYGKARAHLLKKHWQRHKSDLLHESHVWFYSLYVLGLPLTYFVPFYPLVILVPIVKNWNAHPFGLVIHHLTYGIGVLSGTFKVWQKS